MTVCGLWLLQLVALGNSKAQEAAAKANPPPFNPALLGGSLGAILLGFGIFSNRGSSADSQISSSKTGGSAETSSGEESMHTVLALYLPFLPFGHVLRPSAEMGCLCRLPG